MCDKESQGEIWRESRLERSEAGNLRETLRKKQTGGRRGRDGWAEADRQACDLCLSPAGLRDQTDSELLSIFLSVSVSSSVPLSLAK